MMNIRQVHIFFALIAMVSLLPAQSFAKKTIEQCDPRRVGFWENLGCQDRWRERIAIREAELTRLQSEFDRLVTENADLEERIAISEEMVAHLEKELEPSRQRIEALASVRLTQENYKSNIRGLIRELEFLARGLDIMAQAEVGCATKEYTRQRVKARIRSNVVEELIGFGVEMLKTEALGRLAISRMREDVKPFARKVFNVYSTVSTMVDGYNRFQRLGTEKVIYETYTEEVTRCS